MTKFANESARGRAFAASLKGSDKPTGTETVAVKAQKVDPSVTIGPLPGEPKGCVAMNSPAYTGKWKGYPK